MAGPPACSAIVGHGELRRSKTEVQVQGQLVKSKATAHVVADLASGGKETLGHLDGCHESLREECR